MSRGEKLLARMRASKADWSAEEVVRVYLWAGFEVEQGAKHIVVQHPIHPALITTVRRGNPLPTGYIETLLELVDELGRLEGGER